MRAIWRGCAAYPHRKQLGLWGIDLKNVRIGPERRPATLSVLLIKGHEKEKWQPQREETGEASQAIVTSPAGFRWSKPRDVSANRSLCQGALRLFLLCANDRARKASHRVYEDSAYFASARLKSQHLTPICLTVCC